MKNMNTIYTIQNENGDLGFIQKIKDGMEIDEIMGGTEKFNLKYKHCYVIITENEYNIIKWLQETYNETGNENYIEALHLLSEVTIEQNKYNTVKEWMI